MKRIYLDNAATTPVLRNVIDVMDLYLGEDYGNPSSIHSQGRQSRQALEHARDLLANLLRSRPDNLVFTSSGTESVYQALMGSFLANRNRTHIVTTAIEHHAVLHTCELLETLGAQVTYVEPDANCRISPEKMLAAIRPETLLVSVMAVNNETGVVQDVVSLAEQVKVLNPEILVHSDMVQALPVQSLRLDDTSIDLASFSAHKIHGPKGVGALYLKPSTRWLSVLRGGNQERRRRGGTENVAGIVGFGAAAENLRENFSGQLRHLQNLTDTFWGRLREIPGAYRNFSREVVTVPNILSIGFENIPNDVLLMRMDLDGISASAGAACTAGSLEPSHVLTACKVPPHVLKETVRFSFSFTNSEEDVLEAAGRIRAIVQDLRLRS